MTRATRILAVSVLVLLTQSPESASGQPAPDPNADPNADTASLSQACKEKHEALRRSGPRSDYKNFRRGVIAFRKDDWAKTARMMERALGNDERNTGLRVEVEHVMGAAPYLPGYYWGAAVLASNPNAPLAAFHEHCVTARGKWASILSDPCVLEGLPVEAKKRIKGGLEDLEKHCSRIETMQMQASVLFPKPLDALALSFAGTDTPAPTARTARDAPSDH